MKNIVLGVAATALFGSLVGCASNPNSIIVGNGFARFEVTEISKDEFQLTLWGAGVHARDPAVLDEPFDARAKQLCGGRRFLSNVGNSFVPYTSPGAFGSTNRHTGLKRSGRITCQS
jgi:hypothetical protein